MLDFTHLKGNFCQTQGKYLVGLLQLTRLLWLPAGGLEYSLGGWRSQELFLLSWPRAIEQWWWIWGECHVSLSSCRFWGASCVTSGVVQTALQTPPSWSLRIYVKEQVKKQPRCFAGWILSIHNLSAVKMIPFVIFFKYMRCFIIFTF